MKPILIAGPCVIESEELLDTVAKELVRINNLLNVSAGKPIYWSPPPRLARW